MERAGPPRTLVLGMGNPILADDAVGVRLARAAGGAFGGRPDLTVVEECSVGGLEVLEVLQGYDRVVVLDAIRTRGGTPGDWYRFTAEALKETSNLRNVHDVNLATALALGRTLGMPVPPDCEIHVFAVEILDDLTFSERMTDALEAAWPRFSAEILAEVQGLVESEIPLPVQVRRGPWAPGR
ncbi:MAG: hydrogenase maturation protease [Deltaproteobacteria bacterium]|nr:hydrogenase maturation protease [Deltaproteobacteria bacterium]